MSAFASLRPLAALLAVAASMGFLGMQAQAQTAPAYPDKPVRLLVGFAPGTSPDIVARLLAQKLSDGWGGAPVVVENKVGAGGLIAPAETSRARADGYTLLLGATNSIVTAPFVYNRLQYDPAKDFVPVAQVAICDFVLMASPRQMQAKNVQEFVGWAKGRPDGVFMGTFGAGTTGHFATFIFGDAVRLKPDVVHYKSAGDVMTGLISGDIAGVFGTAGVAAAGVANGSLTALGVTGSQRNPALPNVPTMKEQGSSNLDISFWHGLFTPARTPDAVVQGLNEAVRKAMRTDEARTRLSTAGCVPAETTVTEFGKVIEADIRNWGKAVTATGFKAD